MTTACDRCRQSRLKCDGQEPCSRCVVAQKDCSRARSRSKVSLPPPVPGMPKTHYTISEDAIATPARDRLYAIEPKSDPPQYIPITPAPLAKFTVGPPDSDGSDGGNDSTLPPPLPLPKFLPEQVHPGQSRWVEQEAHRDGGRPVMLDPADSKEFFSTGTIPGSKRPSSEDIFEARRKAARKSKRQEPTYFHKLDLKADPARTESKTSVSPTPTASYAEGTEGTQGYAISKHVRFEGGCIEAPVANLALSSEVDVIQQMEHRIQQLEAENLEYHRRELQRNCPTNIQIFHCLADYGDEAVYLSEPDWEVQDETAILRGQFPVSDPRGYVERKGNIAFIVYKRYEVEHQRAELDEAIYAKQHLPKPKPTSEEIELVSDEMIKAVKAFFSMYPTFRTDFPDVDETRNLAAPYIWWYHCRKSPVIQNLPSQQAELVVALTSWIEDNYASLYDQVDDQFRRGRVSRMSMEYLIRPGRVLISIDNGTPRGYVATSRPLFKPHSETQSEDNGQHVEPCHWSWSIKSRFLTYEGDFYQCEKELTVKLKTATEDEEVDIANLNVSPLEYASSDVRKRLRRRGKLFWKCRNKYFVSYEGTSDGQQEGQRFMIDFNTYKELHPSNKYSTGISISEWLGKKAYLSTNGSEPTAPDIYLFPTQVPGFDLRRKKWVDLEVDRIRDVTWNEQAFKSLVADENMKELILALVTNHLAPDKGTDLIQNKGNGLILLLHGSPGTGKTFTAESVAEIARKPLYPVTCGDIGTEPGAVEKYLDSVFHLGKIWDCVVLLDEAEVFLEQRTLQDLGRNALVSVFLRALEYYEGILILTTNRVGTFDEAFKSRIQLALRYEKLQKHQREQIWRNFFKRLQELGEQDSIDFDEVGMHIDELASYPMNGRQIRNSITTARQLAKYRKKMMTFTHLKQAINAAEKFDSYLADVREADVEKAGARGVDGRYSDEYFARTDGIR